jgi:hypothetical protein
MDFPMDFWLFWMCYINVLFKTITNLVDGVLCAKEIHGLSPLELKSCSLERKP